MDDLCREFWICGAVPAEWHWLMAVIMPLLTQHFIMLQRNLFYTALTRAKKLSIIVGSYKALWIAIKNDKPVKRNSLVKDKLVRLAGL